jgi:hypothetical protein
MHTGRGDRSPDFERFGRRLSFSFADEDCSLLVLHIYYNVENILQSRLLHRRSLPQQPRSSPPHGAVIEEDLRSHPHELESPAMATQNKAAPSRSVFSELYPDDEHSALRELAALHSIIFSTPARNVGLLCSTSDVVVPIETSTPMSLLLLASAFSTWEAHRAYLWMPL